MKTGRLVAMGMRRLRAQRGMTQAQLAEAVDLHVQFVSQIEREERSPGVETIDALAEALGVEPWELLKAGVARGEPRKRDVIGPRVRAVIEAWPASEHERLVGILTELGRLASSKRRTRRM